MLVSHVLGPEEEDGQQKNENGIMKKKEWEKNNALYGWTK